MLETISVPNGSIEAQAEGSGEPVLLIHGSILADAYLPLLRESALNGRYRLISYHRRGFARSTLSGPLSIGDQAADAVAVLRHFGVATAHVVGHSYGGAIALQLALDAPDTVGSLALLEPALMMVPSAGEFFEAVGPVLTAFEAGDKAAAVDGFVRGVGGPDYRASCDKALPDGWFQQAVDDANTFFTVELPALQEWAFTADLAQKITVPVLGVLGADSAPLFVEGHELLKQWLPQSEPFNLLRATHLLQIQNAADLAVALSGFFSRHSLAGQRARSMRPAHATHS